MELAKNATLNNAAKAKNDEFYTQLNDIENELRHYREHFKEKVILCNCDDPYESNFFKYFALNFNYLGLKKLIATCYVDSPIAGDQLSFEDLAGNIKTDRAKLPHKIEITEIASENPNGAFGLVDVEHLLKSDKNTFSLLKGDGDFRSDECVELLKQADIVVTNPPFSLFREFIAQLMEHKKDFLIIGSKNAITYKDIFVHLMENRMWLGIGFKNGNAFFKVPNASARDWADGVFNPDTGLVKFRNVGWFTNLDHSKRHEQLILYKRYTPEYYPKYVNYGAVEVSKIAEIPYDYFGEMGVPITFLDKYNPDQFEITGSSRFVGEPMSKFAERGTYSQGGIRFYLSNGDGTYRCLYDRIVIRRRKPQ